MHSVLQIIHSPIHRRVDTSVDEWRVGLLFDVSEDGLPGLGWGAATHPRSGAIAPTRSPAPKRGAKRRPSREALRAGDPAKPKSVEV